MNIELEHMKIKHKHKQLETYLQDQVDGALQELKLYKSKSYSQTHRPSSKWVQVESHGQPGLC